MLTASDVERRIREQPPLKQPLLEYLVERTIVYLKEQGYVDAPRQAED